jgi:hypothetical protein
MWREIDVPNVAFHNAAVSAVAAAIVTNALKAVGLQNFADLLES